ncbi:MAG: FMN-binding protein [Clostridiales bacterium]|nr:FMN-binding protein [Clostridiales bacterium]
MDKASRVILLITLLAAACMLPLGGCGYKTPRLGPDEAGALAVIAGVAPEDFRDVTTEALTKERADKFPAVVATARTDAGLYGFICEPVAYSGPVKLALVIDGQSGMSIGMSIMGHEETDHYVRDVESPWFTGRFAGKDAGAYLQLARLEARNAQDVVCITGATVTTEGIVNGVNAAFGLYREFVCGEDAPPVPLMVRFDPGEGDGPREVGRLAIRAYGVVLGEIPLSEIRGLPSVKRTLSIHSSAGVTQHSFRGALLADVLDLLDPGLKDRYRWLRAVGVDEYISDITMDEVLKENCVYLMYEDDGEALPMKNGEPGAMRVVILDDMFGQRFTNYLLEIVLEEEVAR